MHAYHNSYHYKSITAHELVAQVRGACGGPLLPCHTTTSNHLFHTSSSDALHACVIDRSRLALSLLPRFLPALPPPALLPGAITRPKFPPSLPSHFVIHSLPDLHANNSLFSCAFSWVEVVLTISTQRAPDKAHKLQTTSMPNCTVLCCDLDFTATPLVVQ